MMGFFRKVKIKTQLLLAFLFVIMFFSASSLFAISKITNLASDTSNIYSRYTESYGELNTMDIKFSSLISQSLSLAYATGDNAFNFQDQLNLLN